jgi:Zn-dependent protease/predicted transcriptional regulator
MNHLYGLLRHEVPVVSPEGVADMFGKGIRLFKLLGFEVRIDSSWIFIALLVTWSLATGIFPQMLKDLSVETYWVMGIVGALGLFLSIIIHEFAHSLVARKSGIPMKGITLFIFGGVAEMTEEPPAPKSELVMALMGPVTSIIIGVIFLLLFKMGVTGGWPQPLNGVMAFLGGINLTLAAFNLIPAFPLDGGRILRAILWWARKDLLWATRISTWIGSAFGIILMVLGVLSIFGGDFIGGLWRILIGLFLQNAAQTSYQQLIVRRAFEGIPVRRFMTADPVVVSPSITIKELVENYIYRYHLKLFPVAYDERLMGCVTTQQVSEIPMQDWGMKRVADLQDQCSSDTTIEPDADAMTALAKMNRSGSQRLIVTQDGALMGAISMKDLVEFFSIKMELEGRG